MAKRRGGKNLRPTRPWERRGKERELSEAEQLESQSLETSTQDMENVNISTWNLQGKGNPDDVEKALTHFPEFSPQQKIPHIVCVQQANLPSLGCVSQAFHWLCTGKFGSAVLISKASSLKPGSFEQISEHICVAEVITELGTVMKVISCYIPPSTDYITVDLWQKLVELIKTTPCSVPYIVAGDFNAEIGYEDVSTSGVHRGTIGPKLHHRLSNENGIQLKKLALSTHATIANTFAGFHSKVLGYTYKNGEEQSQRSFILVPSDRIPFAFRILMQDSKYLWHPDYNSALLSKNLKFTLFEKFLKLKSSQVIVSSWNLKGASPSAVDQALSELDLPIVCVQDVFMTSGNDVETKNYRWFTAKKLWGKNVGILIKTSPDISIANFEVASEYLCAGDVTVYGCTIKVICCCLPPHTDSVKFQEVTGQLIGLLKNIPKETLYIVAGDFNTHVTYTVVEDTLVFDEGDGNALFLKKLMDECGLELQYITKNSVTQASEEVRRNSNHILMSPSCTSSYSQRRHVRWIPFFEHGIVILYLAESDLGIAMKKLQDNFQLNAPNSESAKVKKLGKVENVDGFVYETKKYCRMRRYLSINTTEQQAFRFITPEFLAKLQLDESDLPKDIVVKYKNTPPSLEELLRILGNGFTLYFGFFQESSLPKGCSGVLAASFEYLNRGTLLAECIDVFEENTQTPIKRVVKFRWNGIVVYEQDGGKFFSFKRIINKGNAAFVGILGQYYFTVKAKASFYNNGLPPLCQDKDQLNQALRVMKRDDFPAKATVDDVNKFINDFFSGDPYLELVLGPDFTTDFLEPIKKYAINKGFGVRMFKSSSDVQHYDNLSIFISRTPQQIRKKLLEIQGHQDLKFQLLPPSGIDKEYLEWITQWTEKTVPEEYYKLYEETTKTWESNTGFVPTNGKPEDALKPADLEEVIKKQSSGTKRSTGFVQKAFKNLGKQMQSVIRKCTVLASGNSTLLLPKGRREWINSAREETDLPQELVNKYCEAPLPIEELVRILGDEFTLYYGFTRESSVVSQPMEILAESFEAGNRGGVMLEYLDLYRKPVLIKKIVKFKWNGVCIHEQEGSTDISFKSISQAGQIALLNKLGRHFYSVRAKMSFFNKGLSPLYEDKEKFDEAVKVVKKSEFPETVKVEDVKRYISDFFQQDTFVELVFGPDFPLTELLEPIRKFAADRELGYRLFKSTGDVKQWDNISVFVKHSPQELRKRLMTLPDHHDLRFFLIPPSEFPDKSHHEWIKYWASELFADEFKLIVAKEDENPKPSSVAAKNLKLTQNQVRQKRSRLQTDYRKENPRPLPPKSAERKRDWQQVDYRGRDSRPQQTRPDDYDIPVWSGSEAYSREPEGRKRSWQQTDYYGENSRSQQPRTGDYDSLVLHDSFGDQPRNPPPERYVPAAKRAREQPMVRDEKPRWDDVGPLVVVWPVNIRSENEKDPRKVLEANFPTEISLEPNNRVAVYVTLPLRNRRDKTFCLCVGDGVHNTTKQALDLIVKRSSVIKHTVNFLPPDGLVPNFIRYNVPCQTNPRTYIMLSWMDTGPLTQEKIIDLFNSFKCSLNEDLFFDKYNYTHDMKLMLLDLAPRHGLKVRHFGIDQKLVNRYVCVYKTKPKDAILEEVLKMRDFHPKYRLVTNKLPPRLGLNIF